MSDDYWEKAYETGEYKHWEFNYPSPELIALITAKVLRRKARVLDVGSGGGTDAIFMGQCGFNVTGIDISAASLKIAEKRGKKPMSKSIGFEEMFLIYPYPTRLSILLQTADYSISLMTMTVPNTLQNFSEC